MTSPAPGRVEVPSVVGVLFGPPTPCGQPGPLLTWTNTMTKTVTSRVPPAVPPMVLAPILADMRLTSCTWASQLPGPRPPPDAHGRLVRRRTQPALRIYVSFADAGVSWDGVVR